MTPLITDEPRWYPLADVLAAVILGGPSPTIRRAIRFVPQGRHRAQTTEFRNNVELRSDRPFFKVIVEQRQVAKTGAKADPELAALERGLKEMAASGGYGVYAEVNVQPNAADEDRLPGDVYSDICFPATKVHDERPGAFTNPILASLVTGGARLLLAMLEREITRRGGTYALCDTDAMASVCGDDGPAGIPPLPESAISEIVAQFDLLSPFDREKVPHFLKVEHPEISDLRCFAVSAKRYVLFRWRPGSRIQIIKASESALGAIIGRSANETTKKLAKRIWLSILMKHLNVNPEQRKRAAPLIDFDVPMRRKFPISQPSILQRLEAYNKTRSYDHRVKPFGFVQSVIPATVTGTTNPLPIAPFEADLAKSKRLEWVEFNTGKQIRLDWYGSHMEGTLPVMRLKDYITQYQRHPEAKAADRDGNPAGADTVGLLGRLRLQSRKLVRIGKEVDRLDEDEGASLTPERPVEYHCHELAADIEYLAQLPQESTAHDVGISSRAWRSLVNGCSLARYSTAQRIKAFAAECRLSGR